MKDEKSILPNSWEWSTLGELLDRLQYGYTAKASIDVDGPYLLRITDLQENGVDWERVPKCIISEKDIQKYQLRNGDLVFARSGSIEKAWHVEATPKKAVFASYLIRGCPLDESIGLWLKHFVHSKNYLEQIGAAGSGIGMKNVNAKKLGAVKVEIPPSNEQKRIADKIEALQAKSNKAKQALEAAKPLLDKLRQSILAAAFSGDLTADWRKNNPDVEPASILLERIRKERRKRWEETELAKMKAKGKEPENDKWKASYKEPEPIDTTGLPELPKGWCWIRLSDCGEMARGKSKHRPRNDPKLFGNKYPFIQTGEVAHANGIIKKSTTFYSDFGLLQSRLFPIDTVCITIAANIAETAILGIRACFPDSVVGVIVNKKIISPRLLETYIRTIKNELSAFAPATAQKNINLTILREVIVPIPPLTEQVIVDQKIKNSLSNSDKLKCFIMNSLKNLDKLDQSILAKAFRGELVPQDPTDEPASLLLERIKAKREAMQPKKKATETKRTPAV